MKILHTSDLHLGRQFNGIPLEDDHRSILDQIACAVTDHSIDVLILAGDIFDRASPPATAVRQFNGFLERIAQDTEAAVVMIAGNHDSGDRIASMSIMTDKARAHIRGGVSAEEKPLILRDEYGPVAFSGLPFSYEYAARECFEDESLQTPEDVLTAQVARARANVPKDARWVVIAHAFVSGAKHSESERSLTRVGGIETVPTDIFEGAHYVALGHLHRPQKVGSNHIRYSGSPLAFGFDEADAQKSMSFIDLNKEGVAQIETIPLTPMRNVRILRGIHAELLLGEPSTDFIKVVLTDDAPVIDGMKRLREIFPNVCELTYERNERKLELEATGSRIAPVTKPSDVIDEFVQTVRAEAIDDIEKAIIAETLQALQYGEDAA
ncbi:exonuclease subunit SbcD [Sneathiella sp. P13V-1]|uniref:exonuclease SbcCD subunit D n=1 Tax=Sneathiella sp. P13V-1 TaxID=2697366 RepID=UPI00187B44AD|nr:exonuclease SbcCD subunit D [Sneathiella sp. P13V-1]MBE7635956.1 exonuclease subunit SbcD [Sneathiella sp. P13V-1]